MDPITSKDNPLFKRLRTLAQDPGAYRKVGEIWLEGDHLCRALLTRGQQPLAVVHTASRTDMVDGWHLSGHVKRYVMSDQLMASISSLESPTGVGFLIAVRGSADWLPGAPTVILDRLQDPGNVGSILRTASAMGFHQVLALKGTAALWSAKVLRAGMGAHFGLKIVEGLLATDLQRLTVPLLATSSHQGQWLHEADLPWPCAWLMGHEGQGVSEELMARASATVRIAQPGGEESLNVASAAAICLHASAIGAMDRAS